MAGRLTLQARKDWQRITSSGGFEEDIIFQTPDSFASLATATVKGLATKHNLDVDTDGNAVSSKNVHITVSEALLVEAGYPVRNDENEVSLIDHKVQYSDSTETEGQNYVILQCFPDETVGVITCILGDGEPFIQEVYDPLTDDELVMFYDSSGLVVGENNEFGEVDLSGFISNWKNLKGVANYDLKQVTTTSKPILAAGCVACDGVNDYLESLDLPDEIKDSNDFTFIVVSENFLHSVGYNFVVFQGVTGLGNYIQLQYAQNKTRFINRNNSTNVLNSGYVQPVGYVDFSRVNYKSNLDLITRNDTNSISRTVISNPLKLNIGRVTSSSTFYAPTKIKSVMVWKSELNDLEKIDKINTYLIEKWL